MNDDPIDGLYTMAIIQNLFDYVFRSLSLAMFVLFFDMSMINNPDKTNISNETCWILILSSLVCILIISEIILHWFNFKSYYKDYNPVRSDSK